QDARAERAQGCRRGRRQGRAEEGRRRSELGEAARAAVPGHARGTEQWTGRRDLDTRAVPLASTEPGRRTHRDGAGPGARELLPERRLRRAAVLGAEEPRTRGEVPDRDQRVADVRAAAPGRDPRALAGGHPQRAAADLDDDDRPRAAAHARQGREGVRRDYLAPELHAALSERDP